MEGALKQLGMLGFVLASTLVGASPVLSDPVDDLYRADAIVTGQRAETREAGFRTCLERVLVRVSGDQRLIAKPEARQMLAQAASVVQSFSYRDRMAGMPVHDEQGTYDRPYDLTCLYDHEVVDGLLAELGSRPWREERPSLAVFLKVKRPGSEVYVSRDGLRDEAMRQAFALGASPLAMTIAFPSARDAQRWTSSAGSPALAEIATSIGADRALVGVLEWSDADLGWIATWRLAERGSERVWTVRGVNFDEAFRVAVRGAAQILSGNGAP